jgi:hypothetical protein
MQDVTKRVNVIYGNWLVLHPQGFEIFRCTTRKANWYLLRDLADELLDYEKKHPELNRKQCLDNLWKDAIWKEI